MATGEAERARPAAPSVSGQGVKLLRLPNQSDCILFNLVEFYVKLYMMLFIEISPCVGRPWQRPSVALIPFQPSISLYRFAGQGPGT